MESFGLADCLIEVAKIKGDSETAEQLRNYRNLLIEKGRNITYDIDDDRIEVYELED